MTDLAFVAELGQTDRGNPLEIERSLVDFAASGATHIKLQLLIPDRIASAASDPYWATDLVSQREAFEKWGFLDYRTPDGRAALRYLDEVARDFSVVLHATPFDHDAVDLCAEFRWPIKIASGDITNRRLVEHIAAVSADVGNVVMSTGASYEHEIAAAIEWLGDTDRLVLLACALAYPCPPVAAQLCRIGWLADRFGCRVGYSDHTTAATTSYPAVEAGATWLEKHVARHKSFVPDSDMGLSPMGFETYVLYARQVTDPKVGSPLSAKDTATLMGDGVVEVTVAEEPARVGARRSWHATRDIAAGERITSDCVEMLRPCSPLAVPASMDPDRVSLEARRPIEEGAAVFIADTCEAGRAAGVV